MKLCEAYARCVRCIDLLPGGFCRRWKEKIVIEVSGGRVRSRRSNITDIEGCPLRCGVGAEKCADPGGDLIL